MEERRGTRPLDGRSLVLTRPPGEARAFAARLRRLGAEVVQLCPFRLLPREDRERLRQELEDAQRADVVVFASALAARHVFEALPGFRPHGQTLAQGPATAAMLAAHGIDAAAPDTGFRSEDMLAHPLLQVARRVVRITGDGGRDWLVQRLRDRGVTAQDLPVYRREALPARTETLRRIDAMARPQLVVSSRETLLALPTLLGDTRWRRCLDAPLVVASDRLAALAHSLHCDDVVVAASARVDDLLTAIAGSR